MEGKDEILSLLNRMAENQERILEAQKESLGMHRKQFEMAKIQFDRAEKLQERAEKMQDAGATIMNTARRALIVVLPIVIGLIIYLSWLIFR